MTAYRHYPLVGAALFLLGLLATGNATAGIHTWDIVEVFSNADGTVQYIELELYHPMWVTSQEWCHLTKHHETSELAPEEKQHICTFSPR